MLYTIPKLGVLPNEEAVPLTAIPGAGQPLAQGAKAGPAGCPSGEAG